MEIMLNHCSMFMRLPWGAEAIGSAIWLLRGLYFDQWEGIAPRSDEEVADAWIAAAQVCILNESVLSLHMLNDTFDLALKRARASGDVVRAARIVALYLLGFGKTNENVPTQVQKYNQEFDQVMRVGDGFALGMRALALGRWYVGSGGLALAASAGREKIAKRAIETLKNAEIYFERQGMHPWILYAMIQRTKALGDLAKAVEDMKLFDEVQECFDQMEPQLERFPILKAHSYEAKYQLFRMINRPVDATQNLQYAIQSANLSGLDGMCDLLQAEFARWQQMPGQEMSPQPPE